MRKSQGMGLRLACVVLAACLPLVTTGCTGWNPHAAVPARVAKDVTARVATGRVVTGRLANGLRYAILPRRSDQPGLGLVMRNEGGFIAERRPGERGLAHLIEHIAFLSPTRGAPDDLRRFVRIGLPLTLPAPSAGSTSWRESNYYLSTRTARAEDLYTLLSLFRESATDLTFRADAVDTARGEVVREMADKRLGNAIHADYVTAIAPGSPNDVIDAQNSDDVPTAGIAAIRALYERLYRPDTTMIVVVGDVDPALARALIGKRFSDWRRRAAPPRRVPTPFNGARIRPVSASARPNGRRTALISVVMPTPAPAAGRAGQVRAVLIDRLAVRAINGWIAAAAGDAAARRGAFIENGDPGYRQIMVWTDFAPGGWRDAVGDLRRWTCDLATDGLSAAEWDAAKRDLLADLRQDAAAAGRTPNVQLALDLSHAVADGRRLILPDELLRRAPEMLRSVDARAANGWWRRQWRAGTEHLRVEAPEWASAADPLPLIRAAADQAAGTPACRLRD